MPKKVEITKEPKETKSKKDFSFEVSAGDLNYKGKANTLEQAITDFVENPSFPFGVKSKVVIRYGKGTSLHTRIYSAVQARRVLNQIKLKPTAVELLAAQFMNQIG